MRRLCGSGMPTSSSSSRVRLVAALPVRPLCRPSTSLICRSMQCSGLSEVMGSWNTMAMRLPRMPRNLPSGSFSRSLPA
ncbi:hypothetical protein FQZ97_1132100 [compost metagenome]